MSDDQTKPCTRCFKKKPLSEFGVRSDQPTARCNDCRDSLRIYMRKRYRLPASNIMITCGCGSTYRCINKALHEASTKHYRWVNDIPAPLPQPKTAECECGCVVHKKYLSKHMSTPKHHRLMKRDRVQAELLASTS